MCGVELSDCKCLCSLIKIKEFEMYEVDIFKLVMVIGVIGFVVGWLVKGLLESGVMIYVFVCNLDNIDKFVSLNKIVEWIFG